MKIEQLVEKEIRRFLLYLGLTFKDDTPIESIMKQMELMGLRIVHAIFKQTPELNGWHIIEGNETIMIIQVVVEGKMVRIKRKVV